MHARRPPSLQGNSRRAGNDVLHLFPRALLTPICAHGIGQPGLSVLTQTAASCLTCDGLSSYQARQEMPPATSFSMALFCACNKVWLAKCNELQIRRLYLRVVAWPYMATRWRRRTALALSVRIQQPAIVPRLPVVSLSYYSVGSELLPKAFTFPKIVRGTAYPFPPRCVKGRSAVSCAHSTSNSRARPI